MLRMCDAASPTDAREVHRPSVGRRSSWREFYCYDEPDKAANQTQKKWCLERPDKPQSTSDYLMRRWAGGIDNSIAALKKGDDKVRQGIDEMAVGTPLHATTPVREAEAVGQNILSTGRNATREEAKHAAQGVLDAAAAWLKKPWPQKLGDAVESVGDAMASPTTYVPAAGILRAGGKLAEAVEHTADAAGVVGKRGAKAAAKRSGTAAVGEVAEHTDEASARRLLKEAREAEARRLNDAVSNTPAKPLHANKVDDRPATLYKKLDEEQRLQKWGVTRHEDPNKRYTRKEIAGGEVRRLERGPRKEMLQKERELVETNPGPDNREPWAGKWRQ